MYSELNKKINSCKNLNFAIQATCKKIHVSRDRDFCRVCAANL